MQGFKAITINKMKSMPSEDAHRPGETEAKIEI